jgi:hypothetical protein
MMDAWAWLFDYLCAYHITTAEAVKDTYFCIPSDISYRVKIYNLQLEWGSDSMRSLTISLLFVTGSSLSEKLHCHSMPVHVRQM